MATANLWTAIALGVLILLWAAFSSLTGESDPAAVQSAANTTRPLSVPAAEDIPLASAR
jgi:hypothetical protein